MIFRRAHLFFAFALTLTAPLYVGAQTLPPSTNDRQAISQLQYQLTQPGTTPEQRRVIQQQISQLQYQINTRPLISPPSGAPTPAPLVPPKGGLSPFVQYNQSVSIQPQHYGYGSCDADRSMIQYLQAKLKDPSITYQERTYIPQQINDLQTDMRERHC